MGFAARGRMPKRAFAAFLITLLLSLGICLSLISPQKLSPGGLQCGGVYAYLCAVNVLGDAVASGEVRSVRVQTILLFLMAFCALCRDQRSWNCRRWNFRRVAAGCPISGECEAVARVADMVARK